MTIYCSGKSKAIVTFKYENGIEVYTSKNPPIDVIVQGNSIQCGVAGTWTILGAYDSPSQGTVTFQADYQGYVNDNPYIATVVPATGEQKAICDPNVGVPCVYLVSACDGRNMAGDGTNWNQNRWNIRIANKVFTSAGNNNVCAIAIKENGVTVYSNSSDKCPTYTVACEDGCPEGYIKVPTIAYPGYKCREKCPPETCCECDCSNVICCYGSNGQVLKTIPK